MPPSTASNWLKVFSHDVAGGLFQSDDEALSKNPGDPASLLFSRLDQLENFRTGDGKFHLKIVYPELGGSNEWIQTSNPGTDRTIEGFQPVKLDYQQNGFNRPWGGLGLSRNDAWGASLISDTPDTKHWHMCIGCQTKWGIGFPGPKSSSAVTQVELYINVVDASDSDLARELFDPVKCVNYDVTCDLHNALHGVEVTEVTAAAVCGEQCQSHLSECKAWTMIPKENIKETDAKCFFLSSCNKIRPSLGHVSGDYRCPQKEGNLEFCPFFGTTCIDVDPKNVLNAAFPLTVQTPNQCGELCNSDNKNKGGCLFWTMIPNNLEPPASCTLLSSCGTSGPLEGAISGSNVCPPLP